MSAERLSPRYSTDHKTRPKHWPAMAQYWKEIGPPLRPSNEDLEAYYHYAGECNGIRAAPRILLLGVTPELYSLPWPEGHDFLAVDRTREMIDYIWPGQMGEVLEADWLELPLRRGSRDLALCDGGLHLLEYPSEQQVLVDQLHDIVRPYGRCIFRLFVPPARREDQEKVLTDLFSGRITNLNVLKLRLGMALQESAEKGIEVQKIWRLLRGQSRNWEELAKKLGWSLDHLKPIDAYRDSDSRYHFISTEQAVQLFCENGGFKEVGQRQPNYPSGELCRIIAFERH